MKNNHSVRRIFIVGYMASGKTTIAKRLAKELGYLHIDTDAEIERWKNESIPNIFKSTGETAFRSYEKEILNLILQLDNVVISTGGGLPVYHENMEKMNSSGLTFYLSASPKTLSNRIIQDTTIRPLHKSTANESEVIEQVNENLKTRLAVYEKAHVAINAEAKPQEIIATILEWIRDEKKRTA